MMSPAKLSSTMPLRVALVGLGPIGIEIARALVARPEVVLSAAVDLEIGRRSPSLAELVAGAPEGVVVTSELERALERGSVDAIALATSSRLLAVAPDLERAIAHRAHVVSTCEELAAPVIDPALWHKLDAQAKAAGVSVLGTGVNPGFVMDRLVLDLAGACVRVDQVAVRRIVDAAKRRGPLRKKVGEGLDEAEFRAGIAAGRIGHVGLHQSAHLVAHGLGWEIERYSETIDPVLAENRRALGIRQVGRAIVDGAERITLELEMYVGAENPRDEIDLAGDPPLELRIVGGTQGDRGTVGTMVQALARIASAPRGLITVADLFS